jgi:hypothetical protein
MSKVTDKGPCSGCGRARRKNERGWLFVYPDIVGKKLEPIEAFCRPCAYDRKLVAASTAHPVSR